MLACLAQYFSKAEFQKAINDSVQSAEKQSDKKTALTKAGKKGQSIKKIEENDDEGSDSQPSCDNMDQSEMKQIFQEALSDDDMQECFAVEDAVEDVRSVGPRKSDLNVVLEESSEHLNRDDTDAESGCLINNIMDYRTIEQKVIDAKAETAQLTEKFEKLQREIDRKIRLEKQRIGQILQSPMPFRGGWSELPS